MPGKPVRSASSVSAARMAGSEVGNSAMPYSNTLKYSMVPPTSNGMRPAAVIAAISCSASRRNCAAEYDSAGSRKLIKWCGARASVAASGFAVPISIPRYTSAESTLIISQGRCSLSASYDHLLCCHATLYTLQNLFFDRIFFVLYI